MYLPPVAVLLPTDGPSSCRYRRGRRAESLSKEAAARSDRMVSSSLRHQSLHDQLNKAEHRMRAQDRQQGFQPVLATSTGRRRKGARNRHRRCRSKPLRPPVRGKQHDRSLSCVRTCMLKDSYIPSTYSRMRSEQLLALDPRASVQTTPGARQNDREWQQRSRGPPSRAAEASTQRSRPPPAAAASSNTSGNLASRFGMPAGGSSRSGSRPDRPGDGGRDRQGASGLMSRLGSGGGGGGGGSGGQQRRGGARAEAMDLS